MRAVTSENNFPKLGEYMNLTEQGKMCIHTDTYTYV